MEKIEVEAMSLTVLDTMYPGASEKTSQRVLIDWIDGDLRAWLNHGRVPEVPKRALYH